MPKQVKFKDKTVRAVFDNYPTKLRKKLLGLRALIFDTAARTEGVGSLEETLRWGEPSYITAETGSGSTIRINVKGSNGYAIYFHCQTNLVATFKSLYGDVFRFEGKRAIVFDDREPVPRPALRHCIALALTYHAQRKRKKAAN
jgi:hypothetical protein